MKKNAPPFSGFFQKFPCLMMVLAAWLLFFPADPSLAGRSATFEFRGQTCPKIPPLSKSSRTALRVPAPIATIGATIPYTTDHFRILWGETFVTSDPDWVDPDQEGPRPPLWIEQLADALENAYAILVNLGFSTPYGVADYYLDVYVANTGLRVEGVSITLSSDYYAFTDIDTDYAVAYFVFNHDFSLHTDREIPVLRATAAHELFHAIQRMDYPWDDEILIPDARFDQEAWWLESTATWIEEICEPDSDDYIQYIQNFLETPSESLTGSNGKHEYGVAMFAGFLWLKKGGPGLWQDILMAQFEKGVETALNNALVARKQGTFKESVAEFWSLAAHPQDTWPDGALYPPSLPFFQEVTPLPFNGQNILAEIYGAKLFRLPGTVETLEIRLSGLDLSQSFMVSASLEGQDQAQIIPWTGEPLEIHGFLDKSLFLAVVNVSPDLVTTQGIDIQIQDKTPGTPGDLDKNQSIDLNDASLGLQILTGKVPGHPIHLPADPDKTGIITLFDTIFILQPRPYATE